MVCHPFKLGLVGYWREDCSADVSRAQLVMACNGFLDTPAIERLSTSIVDSSRHWPAWIYGHAKTYEIPVIVDHSIQENAHFPGAQIIGWRRLHVPPCRVYAAGANTTEIEKFVGFRRRDVSREPTN